MNLSPATWFRRAIQALIGIVVTYSTTLFAFTIARNLAELTANHNVLPFVHNYDYPMQTAYAWENFATDTILLAMPLFIVAPLKMSIRKKVSLAAVFAAGIL